MDAFHYNARNEKGSTEARVIYNVLGIDKYGHKDLHGMYVSHSEVAKLLAERSYRSSEPRREGHPDSLR